MAEARGISVRRRPIFRPQVLHCRFCGHRTDSRSVMRSSYARRTLDGIRGIAWGDCEPDEFVTVCPECGEDEPFDPAPVCAECLDRPCRCTADGENAT